MQTDKIPFWLKIFIGLVFGVIAGICFHPDRNFISEETASTFLPWLRFPGDVFLNLLQMIMIPLVIASVALGVSSLSNLSDLYKLGTRVFLYFIITTILSISIGISLALLVKPGNKINQAEVSLSKIDKDISKSEKKEPIPKIIADIIPNNVVKAIAEKQMLSLVVFGIFLGIFFLSADSIKVAPLRNLLLSIEGFSIWVVEQAMKIAPFAVFGLMAFALTQIGVALLTGLFYYVLTVLVGLFLVLLMYVLFAYLFGNRKPIQFLNEIREIQILGFSTSSSSSVLPFSLKIAKEKMKIREKIADFVLPLGATVNMDGTALYQGVATIFLSQVYQIDFSIMELILLVFTVTGASIGTAATPGVGIVILGSILHSFHIPIEGIAILFGVDRFLDMCRTSVNLSGDLTATVIMDHWWKD
ncbi:dicarboxylate/amino acid:cation symporter [Leptospira ilyithenensis]|uniref:Dicarboxylate/amino acid:cation symporter n=1 Tax=Leptospira ilyithenensis TaxID=2484901 RepID=A0A4R9LPK1_9LEPT|nr:dicarboxylate/amino acid:cation symporter [Leptospira ilyithenensis]TGN10941.1 dicarboxylate/amino acid:cation symporter [Leptospira ilyithenensis]